MFVITPFGEAWIQLVLAIVARAVTDRDRQVRALVRPGQNAGNSVEHGSDRGYGGEKKDAPRSQPVYPAVS